ncbi:phage tail protein I [Enterobacter kobei]
MIPLTLLKNKSIKAVSQISQDEMSSLKTLISQLNIMDVDNVPPQFLPFLASWFRVEYWDDTWSESLKREKVKQALSVFRKLGTPAAVDETLDFLSGAYDIPMTLVEWFEKTPEGPRGTFEINLDTGNSWSELNDDIYSKIFSGVERNKRKSQHWGMNISATREGNIILAGWMRAAETVSLMPAMTLTGVGVNDWLTSDFSPTTSFSGAVYSLVIQGAMGALRYQATTGNAEVNEAGDVTITGPGTVTVTATDDYGRTLEHSISPSKWVVQDGTMALPGEAFETWLAGVGGRAPEGDELAEHYGSGGARGMGSLSQEWGDLSAFGWDGNAGTSRADLYITGTAEGSEGTHIIAVYLWGNNWGIQSSWPLDLNTPLACCGIIDVLPAGLPDKE